jgi:hypothetical protein
MSIMKIFQPLVWRIYLLVLFTSLSYSPRSSAQDSEGLATSKSSPSLSVEDKALLKPSRPTVSKVIETVTPRKASEALTQQSAPLLSIQNIQGAGSSKKQEFIGELQPALHARAAGLTTCMDNVITQAGKVIDQPHTAISSWSKEKPNDHAFQSIAGLFSGNSLAPNGLALIFAAPLDAKKCEGESVQIYPTGQSCTKSHALLLNFGRTIGSIGNLPIVETSDGGRTILIPSAGGGCVIVSVYVH